MALALAAQLWHEARCEATAAAASGPSSLSNQAWRVPSSTHSFIDLLRSSHMSGQTLFVPARPDCRHSFLSGTASQQFRDTTVLVVSAVSSSAWVPLSCPKPFALPAIPAGFHNLSAAEKPCHLRSSDMPSLAPASGSARGLCCARG